MGILSKLFSRSKPEEPRLIRRSFGMSGGTIVSEDSCMEVSAFYRGVIYISSQVAKLPFHIKDSSNKIINNDISYLLNTSPNPEMTAFHFKLFLVQCAIINGNGYAEIERTSDGRVKALWPLNARRVCPYRSSDGTLFYKVSGGGVNGEDVYLPPRNIYIYRNLHTQDAISGQGVVAYAMQTLGISLGADKFANGLFANGGLPSGIITHPGRLNDESFKRMKEDWKANYGGRKTGSIAILEEGVTYSPISHSPDVLQFLESRKFNVTEISRFLGVPPTKLFDSDSAKFNNIEHANLEVVLDTLDAWATNIESETDMKLLSGGKAGRKSELNLYEVFRGDMATRATYFQKMMQSGAMTPNEIRHAEGLPPYEGGDRYYIATNNFTPEDKMDELLDSQIERNSKDSSSDNNDKTTSDNGSDNNDNNSDEVSAALVRFFDARTNQN